MSTRGSEWLAGWEKRAGIARRRPRVAAAVMLLMACAPLVLAIDGVGGRFASPQTAWSERIDERAHEYAARVRGPKVLIVGGSNVIFGVLGARLEKALKLPVVVYGVNAGAGLDVIVERAESMVGAGDLVVLMPELHHFQRQGPIDRVLRSDFLVRHGLQRLDARGRFPLRQWIAMRERCRGRVMRAEACWSVGLMRVANGQSWREPRPAGVVAAYDLRAIDERGELRFARHRRSEMCAWQGPAGDPAAYDWERTEGARALRRLAAVCAERGATLGIAPAARTTGGPGQTEQGLRMVTRREADLMHAAKALGAVWVLGAGQTTLGPEMAYDTSNHMNDEGAETITRRLASGIKRVLAARATP